MADWIIERLPKHEHFIESCAGSAAVLAAKPPSTYETANDIYGDVVNFFRVLRDKDLCAELIDLVAFTPYSHADFIAAGDAGGGALERAYKFFIRMQMAVVPGRTGWSYSVGGASGRKANKPGRWATMPEHLKVMAERFERVQITDWPIDELLMRFDRPGVLHFVDPPYLLDSRPRSTKGSSGYKCDDFDHFEFVERVRATKHAEVLLVHYPHDFYDQGPWELLGEYNNHRNIPNGRGRSPAIEGLYKFDRSA